MSKSEKSWRKSLPKKVLVLTGKRGGYGAMRNMLTLLRGDPFFDLCLVATDMHLRHEFGYTVDEVNKDFPNTHTITLNDTGRTPASRASALGELQSFLVTEFEVQKPDCLILIGDRGESLVAATAALHMSIPIAHIQGGDRTGGIDNSIRRAISQMATWHFVSCADSLVRISRIVEEFRVYEVGDLHIDAIRLMDKTHEPEDGPGIIIVIYHPETGPEASDPFHGIAAIMDAVHYMSGKKIVLVYPCSDPGYKSIIKVLEHYSTRVGFHTYKNMDQDDFLNLLSRAELIVGNSSCGIIEAPYLGIPAVNVGSRQEGRWTCGNVVHCTGGAQAIGYAIAAAMLLESPSFDKSYYGDGHAGEKIVEILREVL